MTDCLDCFHCKIIMKKGIVRCRKGHWRKDDLTEKLVKLKPQEIRGIGNGTFRISWREVFQQSGKCIDVEV